MEVSMPPPTEMSNAPQAGNDENIGSPDDDKAKRKRQPRNSACQPCASLKMKCVPSSNLRAEPGTCERCHRMNRECVPAIPKPRKRRAESEIGADSAGGIPLSNLLEAQQSTPGSAAKESPKSTPRTKSAYGPGTSVDSLLSRTDIRHTGSKSFSSLFAQGLRLDFFSAAYGDILHGIDYNLVQNSFTVFRQFAAHFPFVSVRHGADTVSMLAQRPFMTAAICTVNAAANSELQGRLSHSVRLALSARAIVEGERNIDLLIGLLIYLAWHHHYLSKQQVYQYLCLLAGMTADLGLYRPTAGGGTVDISPAIERDRAFLGCYYLCTGLSTRGFNKPNPLRWTDNLRQCAENVGRNGSLPSDRNLVAVIELAHAVQEMEDVLQAQADLKRSTVASFVDMHAKATSHRLKGLRRDYPSLNSDLGFAAATIQVHCKLLAASDPPDTSTLIQCACTIKEYIDDILSRTPTLLHQMSLVDWSNLLEILILMAKISKPLPNTGGWETGALSSMLQPDRVLDTICTHMASAPLGDPLAPRHEGLLQWFRAFCDSIKRRIIHDRGGYDDNTSRTLSLQAPFKPANDGVTPITELPLPYDSGSGYGSIALLRDGILDEAFLSHFMRP